MATQTAGTLIGAVLESVGYHYQSHVLDALQAPFQDDVGGFIYLIGIVLAVCHVAIRGEFKLAPWLLIGPPLFFSVVLVRDPVNNARWVFGRDPRNQGAVDHQVQELLASQGEAAGGQARVSRLFARYTDLISKTVQEIVGVINDGRDKTDLWFVLKAELFARMYAKGADTTGLTRLIYHGLGNECGRVIELAWRSYDPLQNQLGGGGSLQSPLSATQQEAQREFDRVARLPNVRLDPVARRFVALRLMGPGPHQEADIERRMLEPDVNRNYSCLEIWDIAREELLEQARRQLDGLQRDAVINGIEASALVDFLSQANGLPGGRLGSGTGGSRAAAIQTLVRIMAKYILRNTMQDTGRGSFIEGLAERQEVRDITVEGESRNSAVERARLAAREWSEKARLAAALTNIPFYQGLALYFLGVFFPFFALLLLIPGKHAGFILWFILWLWIKSWDVALAMIMLVDDILFSLLAVGRQRGQQEEPLPLALDAAIRSLREIDPSFQLATYYSLISVAVVAIPVITAQLIMGSLKGGSGLISQGLNRFGGVFTEGALARSQQVAISNLRAMSYLNRYDWARQYNENVKRGRPREDGDGTDRIPGGSSVQPLSQIGLRTVNQEGVTARGSRIGDVLSLVGFGRGATGSRNMVDGMTGYGRSYGGGRVRSTLDGPSRNLSQEVSATRWRRGLGIMDGAIDAATAMGTRWVGYEGAMVRSDLEMGHRYGVWDAAHSERERHYIFLATVYGQLQVPWSGFIDVPYEEEFNRANAQFQRRMDIYAEGVRQTGRFVDRVAGAGATPPPFRPNSSGNDVIGAAMFLRLSGVGAPAPLQADTSRADRYSDRMRSTYERVSGGTIQYQPRSGD